MAATKKTETKAAVVNETAKPVAEVKEAAPEAAAPEVKEIVKTPEVRLKNQRRKLHRRRRLHQRRRLHPRKKLRLKKLLLKKLL